MSAAQFFQVVLLPQGEFAKFLRADAKDKEALLQKLFGTDRFRKVEDWLADRRRASEKEVGAALDTVAQLVARIAQAAGPRSPTPPPYSTRPNPDRFAFLPVGLLLLPLRGRQLPGKRPGPRLSRSGTTALSATRRPVLSGCEGLIWTSAWPHSTRPSNSPTVSAAARASRRWVRPGVGRLHPRSGACAPTPTLLPQPRRPGYWCQRLAGMGSRVGGPSRAGAACRGPGTAGHGRPAARPAFRRRRGRRVQDEAAATARTRAAQLADDIAVAAAEALQRQVARPPAEQARDVASNAAAALPAAQARADRACWVASDSAALVAEDLREARRTARGAPVRPGGVPHGPGRGAPHSRRADRRHARRTGRVDDRRKPLPGLRLTRPPGPG